MGTVTAILLGIIFGILIGYSKIDKFDTICGFATFSDFTLLKVLLTIFSIGAFCMVILMSVGFIPFYIPPLNVNGVIFGAILFGCGLALLGLLPSTLPLSASDGSIDAMFGILGALCGAIAFSFVYPDIQSFLGPEYDSVSLYTSLRLYGWDSIYLTLVATICIIFISFAFFLNRIDKRRNNIKNYRWLVTGIGISILNIIVVFSGWKQTGIGSASAYPYLSDLIVGDNNSEYFKSIVASGQWELKFISGMVIYGLLYSLLARQFRFNILNTKWLKYRGSNPVSRILWSMLGGFILIFGARMANGGSVDNLINGGMQFAFSSYLFISISLISFLCLGTLFYNLGGLIMLFKSFKRTNN